MRSFVQVRRANVVRGSGILGLRARKKMITRLTKLMAMPKEALVVALKRFRSAKDLKVREMFWLVVMLVDRAIACVITCPRATVPSDTRKKARKKLGEVL